MSTDATGGGQPGADGAVEPEVAAEGTEPTAMAVAPPTAWDTTTPSAWGTPEEAAEGDVEQAAIVPGPAQALDETAGEAGSDAAADEPDKGAGRSEPDQVDEVDDPDEAAAAEYDEDYDEYADDEAAAEYGEYEPEEAAAPQRSRRWPRVLLALGFVVLAAVIVGGAFAIVGSITHGFKKPVKVTYKKSALFSLKTGECFNPQGQSYALISCDSPHQAEVFATFTLSGTKYPGATAIAAQASDGCTTRLTSYVNPQLALSLTSTYVYPDSVAWQAGTRTVICEVRASNGTLTGSVRSASAS
jgi:hypothetical protein